MGVEPLEGGGLAGLGAVDQGAEARQVPRHPGTDVVDDVVEGEVRQPDELATEAHDLVEQNGRTRAPGEGIEVRDRAAHHHRRQEAGDQSHVVVERQPGDDPGSLDQSDGPGIALHLRLDRRMGQHHPLLERRGAGAVLKQGELAGLDLR